MLAASLAALLASPPAHGAPDTVAVIAGRGVLLTAPHAVPHARHPVKAGEQRRKKHDGATGQMVELLARETGALALIARPPWTGNANADLLEHCPFKQTMVELIDAGHVHTVIDLHGMAARGRVAVCIGTGGDPDDALASELGHALSAAGLSWRLNDPFAGAGAGTVRTNARAAGAQALQLELAPWCRDPFGAPGPTGTLLAVLAAFCARLL